MATETGWRQRGGRAGVWEGDRHEDSDQHWGIPVPRTTAGIPPRRGTPSPVPPFCAIPCHTVPYCAILYHIVPYRAVPHRPACPADPGGGKKGRPSAIPGSRRARLACRRGISSRPGSDPGAGDKRESLLMAAGDSSPSKKITAHHKRRRGCDGRCAAPPPSPRLAGGTRLASI